jgi:hypothetical protein
VKNLLFIIGASNDGECLCSACMITRRLRSPHRYPFNREKSMTCRPSSTLDSETSGHPTFQPITRNRSRGGWFHKKHTASTTRAMCAKFDLLSKQDPTGSSGIPFKVPPTPHDKDLKTFRVSSARPLRTLCMVHPSDRSTVCGREWDALNLGYTGRLD